MAKKTLLDTLTPKPSIEDLDKIAEQIHRSAQNEARPEKHTSKTAAPAKKEAEPIENDQHRLTIDLPKWLVATIKTEGKKNGLTVRGVILSVLLEKFRQ